MSYEDKVSEVTFATVDKLTDLAKELIEEKTPEDTKTLVGNMEKLPTRREWESVIGEIKNETPYAIYVEYGVHGKEYTYHKPKWKAFYRGVGAGMVARTNLELIEKGEEIIMEAFDTLIDELNSEWS